MPPTIPLATYRLQLTAQLGLDEAALLVPYLKALGISHLYLSPLLKSRRGSAHGYDVVDHNAVNPELGGRGGSPSTERGACRGRYRPKIGRFAAVLALHHLLERQHYRLAHWRLSASDINYRRFFDVNSLAGHRAA